MLETLSQGFRSAKNLLSGKRELTESNIDEALKTVRLSLLEADVEYNVVSLFLSRVKEKSLGTLVQTIAQTRKGEKHHLSPADHFVGICFEELKSLMGPVDTSIKMSQPVATIMMVGLQGAGKTTTTGKLAVYLMSKKLRPLLVAADIYRPAAVAQLQVLGEQIGVPVFTSPGVLPPQLCKMAFQKAKELQCNVVIFDTAGRLAIDDALMAELEQIKQLVVPDNIFLVVDAMIGQDAVKTANEFNRRLGIDGFIMTKLDGDARGGAALSIKEVTGCPIKFLGQGEKLDALEEFRPDGLASRILGMGDVVSLVQDFEKHVDEEKAEKDAQRMMKGQMNLQDFLEQFKLIKKMGSLQSIMEKMPGMSEMLPPGGLDEKELGKWEAIVLSMTPQERVKPELFQKEKKRKIRVSKGSGTKEKDLDTLLQRFAIMKQMMGLIGTQPSFLSKLPGFNQLGKMAQMAKAYKGLSSGALGNEMADFMQSMGNPFGGLRPSAPMMLPRSSAVKSSKDKMKRKAQKAARKKNKRKK